MHRRRFTIALAAAAALPRAGLAQSAPFPNQPVKIVAPFPPGGGADIIARLYATQLAASLGQPFVVENKPGAGTLLAASEVARAPANGYTLIAVTADTLAVASSLYKSPPVIPERTLAPIAQIVRTPLLVVVRPESPHRTLADVVQAARAAPGKLTVGSAGVGTVHHLAIEQFARAARVEVKHVPYRGSALGLTDLLGGHIDAMFLESPLALPNLRGNKVRALAITTPERLALADAVPTVAEQGFPGFEALTWMGFAAPQGTPPEVIGRLHAAIGQATRLPELSTRLRDMGLDTVVSASPEAFAEYAARERDRWGRLIREANISAE